MCRSQGEEEEKDEEYDEEDLVKKAEDDFFDTIEHAVKLREKKDAEKRKQEEALMRSSNEAGSGKVIRSTQSATIVLRNGFMQLCVLRLYNKACPSQPGCSMGSQYKETTKLLWIMLN